MNRNGGLWNAAFARAYAFCFRTLNLWVLTAEGTLIRPGEYECGRNVFAHSESDALVLAGCALYSKFAVLVDRSRDGEWASRFLKELNLVVIRGSTLHDGSRAFRDLLRVEKEADYPIAICVDGPLGPRGEAKEGVIVFGKHTARPIIPVATASRYHIVIPRTWSGIFIPVLFSRTVVSLGEPIDVPPVIARKDAAALTQELTRRIGEARRRAEEAVRR